MKRERCSLWRIRSCGYTAYLVSCGYTSTAYLVSRSPSFSKKKTRPKKGTRIKIHQKIEITSLSPSLTSLCPYWSAFLFVNFVCMPVYICSSLRICLSVCLLLLYPALSVSSSLLLYIWAAQVCQRPLALHVFPSVLPVRFPSPLPPPSSKRRHRRAWKIKPLKYLYVGTFQIRPIRYSASSPYRVHKHFTPDVPVCVYILSLQGETLPSSSSKYLQNLGQRLENERIRVDSLEICDEHIPARQTKRK